MGSQISSSNSFKEDVAKIVNKIVISNKSNCTVNSVNTQQIKLGNIDGDLNIEDIDFERVATVNLNCLQSSDNNLDIVADIKKELEAKIKDQLSGQNFGLQSRISSSLSKSITDFSNNINIDNIKVCLVNSINNQSIETQDIGGGANIRGIRFKSTEDVVQKCMQSDLNNMKQLTKLHSTMKDEFENSITGFLNSGSFIIIVIVIIALMIAYYMFKKNTVYPPQYPMYPPPRF